MTTDEVVEPDEAPPIPRRAIARISRQPTRTSPLLPDQDQPVRSVTETTPAEGYGLTPVSKPQRAEELPTSAYSPVLAPESPSVEPSVLDDPLAAYGIYNATPSPPLKSINRVSTGEAIYERPNQEPAYVKDEKAIRTVSEPTKVHSPIATPMPAKSAPAEPREPSPALEDVLSRQPTPPSDQRPPERQPTIPRDVDQSGTEPTNFTCLG